MGSQGRSPKRGEGGSPTLSPGTDAGRVCPNALCKDAYKWLNKVGAGRTDNKRPRLHRCRANQAYTAFHRGEGVWGFGKDAEIRTRRALHEAKPSECPKGDRGSELEVCFKNILFLQTETTVAGMQRWFCISWLFQEALDYFLFGFFSCKTQRAEL